MLLGTRKTLYDHITEALLRNPMSVSQIQTYLQSVSVPASVQGIYKTLRELIAEDIIVKQKKIYQVSNVWREKLSNLIEKRQPFTLHSGEAVSYRFTKLDHTDAFWKHAYADISNSVGPFPAFVYMPHEFWIFISGRRESELEYFNEPKKTGIPMYTIIGGQTPVDLLTKTLIVHEHHPVHLDAHMPFNRRDHIVILGYYIVTTRISQRLAQAIDYLYENNKTEPGLISSLESTLSKQHAVTMTVEHDKSKAKKLRKRLSMDLHVPKELRDQFDLF